MEKIILVGYPGSQFLVPASRYLVEKYMPGFEVTFLNYEGPIEGWSAYLADHFRKIEDKLVIFALDDYLINSPINMEVYEQALQHMQIGRCAKLCPNTSEELNEYPICTQYCIWNREFLMKILDRTTDPWNFEIEGSRIFRTEYLGAIGLYPCVHYDVHTALSKRWEGVNWNGVKEEDIKHIKENLL